MGLLEDVLKTIQISSLPSDPRAKPASVPAPAPAPSAKPGHQGMSPMAKVLLALLAVYAAKNIRRAPSPDTHPASPPARPGGTTTAATHPGSGGLDELLKGPLGGLFGGGSTTGASAGGGLGDLLKGPLGGILGGAAGGAAAGTILNGGLNDLLKQFQQHGQGDVVQSWVGSGPNRPISPTDLETALGMDTLSTLSRQSGIARGDLLAGLTHDLPRFVDALTPDGRLLTEQEATRLL